MSTSRVLQHLYLLDASSPDLLRYLYYLIQNDDEEQYLSSLQGSELTRLVDFLDGVLDVTPITDDVSRRCLHKLQAICGHHKILPSSYNVSGDLTRVDSDPVASGGFSDVWEGIHDAKKVCIKRLRITQQSRQVVEKAFCKEAVMWKRLRHPNVVGLIGVTRNPLQFVSEWMPNGTLTDYLSENPGANQIGLLLDVAEGLTFLHAIHTTHGDLKGPNVLIDYGGHARLTDFGFTSVVRGVDSILVTGVQGYSARWAAPEVLGNGDRNTREADVFSFGMIVMEVFTGRHPFSEFSALATISKIVAGERPDRPQEPGLTDLVWDTTRRCWDEDPVQRPTMTRVVGILRECSRLYNANLTLFPLAPLSPEILASLPESELERQRFIRKVIAEEQQYIRDLNFIEEVFILPLRNADPTIFIQGDVNKFINEVFGKVLDLRECHRRLLETMYARQREQGEIFSGIGDIFLNAATEFQSAYPAYISQLAAAERRLEEEIKHNEAFGAFLEQCSRHPNNVEKMELRHWLNHPPERLREYPVVLEHLRWVTAPGDPDVTFLEKAIEAMRDVQGVAQLKTFQRAMGRGPTGRFEWYNLVPEDVRREIPKQVAKRQAIIFELIKGEMEYVKDLENIEHMFIQPLRSMDPPIIPPERLESFIQDVFHNFRELHVHHKQLLDQLFEIQIKEHPIISSITLPMIKVFLKSRDAYLKYNPNSPIAEYHIDGEMASNPQFKAFVEQCVRHPDARRLDMKNFAHRPIPRLLRYKLLLGAILDGTAAGHEDLEAIPAVLNVIEGLEKEIEPRIMSAMQKVNLWRYNASLVFKAGEHIDMDLLNENRLLIHTGKFLRQPEIGFGWNGWTELFVLLFDNYFVMTKPKEKDGVTKYQVDRRPILLDFLSLAHFTDPPVQRGSRLLPFGSTKETDTQNKNLNPPTAGASPNAANDSRAVYPCTFIHHTRLGGLHNLFAESSQARLEWKAKLKEAIESRKAVQESNKVFEVETLSVDTFYAPPLLASVEPSLNNNGNFTSKVTCSVPFSTLDGRALVAIGCAEGVWIGFRRDSRSMRRVLHLRMVTQCAMLEDFGIFLVLADKSLFAYDVEALVPSSSEAAKASQTPQKLSGNKDVQFFTVGNLGDRTLVIYMKKKNLDSVFRVLEPVIGKINERTKTPPSIESRFGLRSQRAEWFRVYRDFFSPSESYDLLFLKARIVILCSKGFEIMNLSDFKSVIIPQKEDPRLKRTESCRPMGMFRSKKDEFLLCYDEFGIYVDKHGDPSRYMCTVEWEGTAERVAWHPPYILLFNSRFIEIRHVETGRLIQTLPGNDIRCTWDGRGTNQHQAIPEDPWGEVASQQLNIHGVMNTEMSQAGKRVQHVFELAPKVPLS